MEVELTSRGGEGELLRHRDFVRRLARELAGPVGGEDLEQDAWVAALESPPRLAAAARGWFRTVLCNLAHRRSRAESRRAARELAVARAGGSDEPGEPFGVEPERVLRAVEGLREPYRSAIRLRYLEDLSPPDIAAREAVPVATVKTRLRRGLAGLRAELGSRRDERELRAATTAAALALKGAAALVGVAVLTGGLLLLRAGDGSSGRGSVAADSGDAPAAGTPVPASAGLDGPRDAEPAGRESLRGEGEPAVPSAAGTESAASEPGSRSTPPPPDEAPRLRVLAGRVLLPGGRGAAGARVALGPWQTLSSPDGRFELLVDLDEERPFRAGVPGETIRDDAALVATLADWIPAVEPDAGRAVLREDRPLRRFELVLPGTAERISGRVLDGAGVPGRGWRVALLGGTLAFRGRHRPYTVEDLASGVDGHQVLEDGSFAFVGLTPEKEYRVQAWNGATLERATSEPIRAGTSGILLQASPDPWRTVDGVVLGLDGEPLEGVRCRLSMHEYRHEPGTWDTGRPNVFTDSRGHFELVDVPPTPGLFLRLGGDTLELPPPAPGPDLVHRLARAGTFVFRSRPGPDAPDTLVVLDAAGERLRIQVRLEPGRTHSSPYLRLEGGPLDGEPVEARVSEEARTLVLLRQGVELVRLPLRIDPDSVVEIED